MVGITTEIYQCRSYVWFIVTVGNHIRTLTAEVGGVVLVVLLTCHQGDVVLLSKGMLIVDHVVDGETCSTGIALS